MRGLSEDEWEEGRKREKTIAGYLTWVTRDGLVHIEGQPLMTKVEAQHFFDICKMTRAEYQETKMILA